ncbi:MAG: type II toxin-antitoxin system HicB family antitoxin [Bacteroidales bacterium]|nr:type II toxin-antitoxin system HicB family antitoxin [Bacteroidales bacterium]
MSTQKVIINVDWVPSNFGAAPANEGLACVATGKTLEEVQKNIIEAIRFHLEEMREDGETIPEDFVGEWEPEFRLTTRAQLKYADNYITRKALARETGIAEQQLSHYANGQRHPRPAMQQRISAGIQAICQRLAFIC